MSAAIASAAAATVWAYAPELRPDQVAETLYASGVDLGYPTDFCLAPTAGPGCSTMTEHRLSVCEAVRHVCQGDAALKYGAHCAPPPCSTPGAGAAAGTTWSDAFVSSSPPPLPYASSCATRCVPATQNDQGIDTKCGGPWVGSQPGAVGCPSCVLDRAGTLWLNLNPTFASSVEANSMTLTVESAARGFDTYPLPDPGGKTMYSIGIPASAGARQAFVTAIVASSDGRVVDVSPVAIAGR
jgi:hypothetical protein